MPKKTLVPVPQPEPNPDAITRSTKSLDNIKAAGGSGNLIWDMMAIERTAMAMPGMDVNGASETKFLAAEALRAFAPKDAVEAMIATQAVSLHFASLECSRRALLPQQSADVAARLRRDAANTARAMVDMCEALDRRRGKGPQVVRVERVVVHEGGQAVVGNVATSALGRGEMPMRLVDPVSAEAEGEGS